MATPLAHSLLGATVFRALGHEPPVSRWRWYTFAIFAACAADLDLVPGLIVGDINRFHHGASHSLIAALTFGFLAMATARWLRAKPWQVFAFAVLGYSSHLLLDYFCVDSRPPYGMPFLWPFSDTHWLAPHAFFGDVKHGVPGDTLLVFLDSLFSWHNLGVLVLETAVLLPILLMVSYLRKRRLAPLSLPTTTSDDDQHKAMD